MADCPYTCFDRVLNLVQKVSKDKVKELDDLYYEDDINKVLEFGVKNDCFTKSQAQTLYDGIVLWKEEPYGSSKYDIVIDDNKKNSLFKNMGDDNPNNTRVRLFVTDAIITSFEKALEEVKECPKDKLEELYEITTEDGLREVIDFGIDNQLFDEKQSRTLYEGIIMWEDENGNLVNGNYYEEDPDKYDALLSHMGVDFDKLQEWRLAREENEGE